MKWYRDVNVWIIIGEAVCGITAIGLLIAGFCLPPIGTIDPSVLQGVGEVFAFATLWQVPSAIKAGKTIKVEHNGTTLTVEKEKKE